MVSNSLNLDLQEIVDALKRLRRGSSKDPQYEKLRAQIPEDWPI
jgi:hypothetical protein